MRRSDLKYVKGKKDRGRPKITWKEVLKKILNFFYFFKKYDLELEMGTGLGRPWPGPTRLEPGHAKHGSVKGVVPSLESSACRPSPAQHGTARAWAGTARASQARHNLGGPGPCRPTRAITSPYLPPSPTIVATKTAQGAKAIPKSRLRSRAQAISLWISIDAGRIGHAW